MNKQIIFNLAVKDLDKSKAFFSALGFASMPNSAMSKRHSWSSRRAFLRMLMTEDFFAPSSTSHSPGEGSQ
jgi:predicted lactoylglutathione lyase